MPRSEPDHDWPDPYWPDTLRRKRPDLSAAEPMARWQRFGLAGLVAALATGLWLDAAATACAVMALLSPVFLCAVAVRAVALAVAPAAADENEPDMRETRQDGRSPVLPVYAILVPLYREAAVVPGLVRALDRLEWPKEKRHIVFATEADDVVTRQVLATAIARHCDMEMVVVPPGEPRTKPRALMYALGFARGDLVVVYDAEDEPEPDQLRRAHRHLCRPGAPVGCVQARLNVYNARQSLISRQFALEYTALFDRILPALQRIGVPVPLGGTSNHFRRDALEAVGGWDPYNVTEDADLGVRLARQGWRVEPLASTTWEEAPATFGVWLGQRTRWLKGWMQTCLVHLRRPAELWRELGPRGFLGFGMLMGGMILSALSHPLVYAYAAVNLWSGAAPLWPPDESWPAALWWLGMLNLGLAYVVGIALAVVAARRRHPGGLARHALLIPIYWMMISLAAYRALADLVLRPFHWRKTTHSGRSVPARPVPDKAI